MEKTVKEMIKDNEYPITNHFNRYYLIGVEIGKYSFSSTLKTHWCYCKNISDCIIEANTIEELESQLRNKVIEFVADILNITD